MIRLENVLKISLQDVFARYLEDIFARRLDDVLANFVMMPWRRLEDVFKTCLRRLEDVLKTYGQDEYIGLDQDVFWRHMTKANLFVLIKTSWKRLEDVFWRRRRQASSRRLQDVFIKTNVWCEYLWSYIKIISHRLTISNFRVNYFEAACMIQIKKGTHLGFKHLIQVGFYFHYKEPLKTSAKH